MIQAISDLVYCAGGATWMAIMLNAAMSVPVIGFAVVIPAGLVIYSVRQSMRPVKFNVNVELVLD